jgi:hypothetical protein
MFAMLSLEANDIFAISKLVLFGRQMDTTVKFCLCRSVIGFLVSQSSHSTFLCLWPSTEINCINALSLRDAHEPVIRMAHSGELKVSQFRNAHQSSPKLHYPFWFGGSASSFAAMVTHPLDLGMIEPFAIDFRRHPFTDVFKCSKGTSTVFRLYRSTRNR